MRVWRICRSRFAASAFSGEGARLFSGRWNPVGVRMVYCSSSLALASLEFFVHLDPGVAPDDLVSVAADIPEEAGQIERLNLDTLPSDWRLVDNPALQQLGADWAASLRSLALLVPSAVVDDEWNVLLNPAHAGFGKILMAEPKPFRFDARMFAR